jgi:hypothetical protein
VDEREPDRGLGYEGTPGASERRLFLLSTGGLSFVAVVLVAIWLVRRRDQRVFSRVLGSRDGRTFILELMSRLAPTVASRPELGLGRAIRAWERQR